MTDTPEIRSLKRDLLVPCDFQPRKHFPDQKLNELGAALRRLGVLHPLTARLRKDGRYEIICGECRWRSSAERPHPLSGQIMPPIDSLPVIVREFTDAEALEVMLIENMQRQDLSPMEECDAFARAIDENGHTIETLSERIGVNASVIKERLSLRKLPAAARDALRDDRASYSVMREVCRAPASLVPQIADTVLHPRKFPILRNEELDAPISTAEVRRLVDHLSARLDQAPFDLADEALVPLKADASGERLEGGACIGCQFNSANADDGDSGRGGHSKFPRCLNAPCFRKKVAVFSAAGLLAAKNAGASLANDEDREIILHSGPGGSVAPDYVELDEVIDPHHRAPGITDANAPTWRELVCDESGALLPVIALADERGRVRSFARRELAVMAAEKTGKVRALSLAAGRGRSLDEREVAAATERQNAERLAAAKQRAATSFKIAEALVAEITQNGPAMMLWDKMLGLAEKLSGRAGCSFVCKRRGLNPDPDVFTAVVKHGKGLKGDARTALVIELLVAPGLAVAASSADAPIVPDFVKPILAAHDIRVPK